ncbi:unnamed protein product, partial [Mycena citricolor]
GTHQRGPDVRMRYRCSWVRTSLVASVATREISEDCRAGTNVFTWIYYIAFYIILSSFSSYAHNLRRPVTFPAKRLPKRSPDS